MAKAVEAEREECAEILDNVAADYEADAKGYRGGSDPHHYRRNKADAVRKYAAAKILVRGCSEGWFTGKKLDDYLPGDYRGARRVVNGLDKADLIAGYAREFEAALALLPDAPVVTPTLPSKPVADKTPAQTVAKPSFIARLIAWLFKGRKA